MDLPVTSITGRDTRDSFIKKSFYSVFNFLQSVPNYVLYALLFLALTVVEYYNFHLTPDLSTQLNSLINFSNHHGISLATIDKNYRISYLPCSSWPAGFVIFLLPIFLITKSGITSVLVLNAISYIFYILFLDKYLHFLAISPPRKKFMIGFMIVSLAPFIHFYPSDSLATVICLWGFYYNMKYETKRRVRFLLIAIFLLALTYFIKYSFLPFVFYPLVSFLFKERMILIRNLHQVVMIFVLCVSALISFYLLNKLFVGRNHVEFATTLDLFSGKAHWNQLSHFNGFLFTFGIYEWVVENFFKNHLNLNIHFNWISIIVTVYCYILFLKVFFKPTKNYSAPMLNSINISLSAGVLIIAFLTFLTLNNPGQRWTTPYWTFVQETRYYGPVIIIGLINMLLIFLTERKAMIIHILVPLMIVLNLYGFRSLIQLGFWGNSFTSFKADKNKVDLQYKNAEAKKTIFFFEPGMKNSIPYLVLQSEGNVLVPKDSLWNERVNSTTHSLFLLQKDSTSGFTIHMIK